VRQAESLGEYALAETIRHILAQEQEHQIDLATALNTSVPRSALANASAAVTPIEHKR
jgi:bacterioferritin